MSETRDWQRRAGEAEKALRDLLAASPPIGEWMFAAMPQYSQRDAYVRALGNAKDLICNA